MPQISCNYILINDVKLYSPDQFYVLFANKDCTLLGLLSLMWAETVQSNNIAIRAVLQVGKKFKLKKTSYKRYGKGTLKQHVTFSLWLITFVPTKPPDMLRENPLLLSSLRCQDVHVHYTCDS